MNNVLKAMFIFVLNKINIIIIIVIVITLDNERYGNEVDDTSHSKETTTRASPAEPRRLDGD